MTTYEASYLILVAIQTGFLVWYALETNKLRKIAGEQSKTISDQYKEMAKQNTLLGAQLELNTMALAHQKSALAAETEFNLKSLEHQKEAFKAEQAAERAKFDPIFQVRTLTNANGYIKLEIDSVRTNIIFLKFRANMNIAVSDYAPPSNHKKLVALKNTGATLYLGIEYKTMLGEDAIKVFTIDTSTGRCEPATDHSGTNLPVQATF